ncbi:MAG: peptidoglycan DD-metalloendopeptidase family protein [Chromatiales bacterium]|nr:peptidoglycan DD-metalloendopeptidase family protein [Chromatiales bacterium]
MIDRNEEKKRPKIERRHLHLLAIASIALGLITLIIPTDEAEATRQLAKTHSQPAEAQLSELLALPAPVATGNEAIATPDSDSLTPWQEVTVKSGDTLSQIFNELGLDPQQLHAVLQADKEEQFLRLLRPKQILQFQISDNQLQAMQYKLSASRSLHIQRDGDAFLSQLVEKVIEKRLTHAGGKIDSSLFLAGQEAGLSDNLIMELVGIFGWDIDFALDIRKGDTFSLLYEEEYLDGEKLRDGRILAAEFNNRGESFRAVLFADPEGNSQYYSEDGNSMRKAFLRSPVDFRRISSKFQRERYHPVLGKKRPHRGVDYAASTGTPIKAAGDGKVIFRGTKGGYGRTVILQHGGKYTTLYAHMSSFRKGVGNGSRVKQGQVIGYVGKSGVATGPHLHYEFRVDGVHRNPLTVKFPDAAPVPEKYRTAFMQATEQLLAQLDLFKRVQVASNAQ